MVKEWVAAEEVLMDILVILLLAVGMPAVTVILFFSMLAANLLAHSWAPRLKRWTLWSALCTVLGWLVSVPLGKFFFPGGHL